MKTTATMTESQVRALRAWVDAETAAAVAAALGVHPHTVARWTAGGTRLDPVRLDVLERALARRSEMRARAAKGGGK